MVPLVNDRVSIAGGGPGTLFLFLSTFLSSEE
jgi:hypothetical protein